MPIPLGILAVAGASGGVPAFERIETVSIVGSSTSSLTFSNLNTYTQYRHLQIRFTARSTGTLFTGFMQMRANADSAANYATHFLRGNGTNVASNGFTGETRFFSLHLPNASDTANIFAAGVIDVLDFASANKNTTVRMLSALDDGDVSNVPTVRLSSGLWNNTAAVTSLTIFMENAFTAGSRFSLYGVR